MWPVSFLVFFLFFFKYLPLFFLDEPQSKRRLLNESSRGAAEGFSMLEITEGPRAAECSAAPVGQRAATLTSLKKKEEKRKKSPLDSARLKV